jgi:hypothetical protein
LAAAKKVTVPEPLPLPAVMVSQLALLIALHVQLLPAVTPTAPLPPAAASVTVLVDRE